MDEQNMNGELTKKDVGYLESRIDGIIKRIAVTTQQEPMLIQSPFMLQKMLFDLVKIFRNYFNAFTNPELQSQLLKIVDPSMVGKIMDSLVENLPSYIHKLIESRFMYWIQHPKTPVNLQDLLIQLVNQLMHPEVKPMTGGFSQDDCF